MQNELLKSLTQRAKDLLQTDADLGPIELLTFLRQFRNDSHPDKFVDSEIKEKAEERFKAAQALIEELEKQVEVDRFNRKPSELANYKPVYDLIQLQGELDKVNGLLHDSLAELRVEREKNETLDKQINQEQNDSLKQEIEYLRNLYKPSAGSYASIGLGIVLAGALGIMTQMEQVSGILEKYSPFGKQYISTGLFICLMLFLVTLIRKFWEREHIRSKSEDVCSAGFVDEFMSSLQSKRAKEMPVAEFSEVESFEFISGRKHWLKMVVSFLGFHIYRRDTVNRLNEIFIHNLLNKKLIDVSRAENMQRFFHVLSTEYDDHYWFRQWKALEEKGSK